MGYCFITTQKITDSATLVRKYEHNYRTENVPNAIPELKNNNQELVPLLDRNGNPTTYLDAFKERKNSLEYYKDHKMRKDQVKAIEVLTTFSPKDQERIDIEQWKKDNVQWLKDTFDRNTEKYGSNVISVVFHGDECGNVHCHALVLPVSEDGHFRATEFTGGRKKMRDLQTSYANAMKKHGLQRGLEGSSAKHQDIKKFYTRLNQRMDIPMPKENETAFEYRTRITEFVQTERAASLRELLEKEANVRRKLDQTRITITEEAKKQGDSYIKEKQKEAQHLINIAQNKSQEVQELIVKQKQLEKLLREQNRSYEETLSKTQQITKDLHSLGNIRKIVETSKYQKEVLEYTERAYPELGERIRQNYAAAEQLFQNRELEHFQPFK
ncbi:MAG: plasmid recombination protein [Clostridiales bacterium]|nr:plasmid recombination protein [Clostridiales bacterium]